MIWGHWDLSHTHCVLLSTSSGPSMTPKAQHAPGKQYALLFLRTMPGSQTPYAVYC